KGPIHFPAPQSFFVRPDKSCFFAPTHASPWRRAQKGSCVNGALRSSAMLAWRRLRWGCRLYVLSTNEATHPRCCDAGYPDEPAEPQTRGMSRGTSTARLLSELIRQNRVMQWQLPQASVAARWGSLGYCGRRVLAEIGDLSRLLNPRELMGYLGLVPQKARLATRSTAAASQRPATVSTAHPGRISLVQSASCA